MPDDRDYTTRLNDALLEELRVADKVGVETGGLVFGMLTSRAIFLQDFDMRASAESLC